MYLSCIRFCTNSIFNEPHREVSGNVCNRIYSIIGEKKYQLRTPKTKFSARTKEIYLPQKHKETRTGNRERGKREGNKGEVIRIFILRGMGKGLPLAREETDLPIGKWQFIKLQRETLC